MGSHNETIEIKHIIKYKNDDFNQKEYNVVSLNASCRAVATTYLE